MPTAVAAVGVAGVGLIEGETSESERKEDVDNDMESGLLGSNSSMERRNERPDDSSGNRDTAWPSLRQPKAAVP